MANLFYSCVANSLNLTLFIILLVLLEPVIKKYLSAICLYRLWVILLIGLLIPMRFEFSKALLVIDLPKISVEDKASNEFKIQGSNKISRGTQEDDLLQNLPVKATENKYDTILGSREYYRDHILSSIITGIVHNRTLFLSMLWILGAILLILLKGIQYYRSLKMLRRFMIPVKLEDFIKTNSLSFQELCSNLGEERTHSKIRICICSIITSPMTIGIFRPIILLPKENYSDKDFCFILKHELIHIQRRDSLVKLIRLIVLSFNWYNPFCYILSRHLDHWCEVSCDELVICNFTRKDRLDYSKLLLKCSEVGKKTTPIFNMIGGKDNMRNRLHSIINHRKKNSGKILIALMLCMVFTTVLVSVSNRRDVSASNDNTTSKDNTIATEEALVQSELADEYITDEYNMAEDKADEYRTDEKKAEESKTDEAAMSSDNALIAESDIQSTDKNVEPIDSTSFNAASSDSLRESVVEYALQAEGTPYVWGGDDLSLGVDSSGFTQAIYKKIGYDLPRTSADQASNCDIVSLDNLQPGDLIFYAGSDDTEVNHVGIYIGEDKIIHAKNAKDGVMIQDLNYRTPLSAGRVITN